MSGSHVPAERRVHPRYAAAFAFWFNPVTDRGRYSGWMLNLSAGGAAFLTSAASAPAVGARIQFSEMFSKDRLTRNETCRLPRFARVMRVESPNEATRQVAVRFEAEARERQRAVRIGQFVTRPLEPGLPPPLPALAGDGPAPRQAELVLA